VSAIVDELRRLTAAPAGRFNDQALKAALAARVSDRPIQRPVDRIRTIAAGGTTEVRAGSVSIAGTLDAEAAVVLDTTGAVLAADEVTVQPDGHMAFAEDVSDRSLRLTGLAYDLNGAAADVLTSWAAMVAEDYDVMVDGQSMKRSQRHAQLLKQAETFRSKALIGTVSMKRHDLRHRTRNRT
jgi:hypothetical protein